MIARESFFSEDKLSVSGKNWQFSKINDSEVLMISQNHGLPEIVSRVLVARGVNDNKVGRFLSPKLKDHLGEKEGQTNPMLLKDMKKAAERIVEALSKGEQIAIFGDYDVDGATSSALLYRFFQSLGHEVHIHIPDRINEGYGPQSETFMRLEEEKKVNVIITVDCGTTAFDELEIVKKNTKIDVIVVDHHQAETRLPASFAVVNPNRVDEECSDAQDLAAVGVSYLFIIAIRRVLRESGWFTRKNIPEPDLKEWLDLVALGTVCDLVKLKGLNRALVAQGLKVACRRKNTGIAALSDVAQINEQINCYHMGFLIGPRINAGGRIGESDLGSNLLKTDDSMDARECAQKLDILNKERQEIEKHVFSEASSQIERDSKNKAAFVLASSNWHQGVLGIVASRLKEIYNKPVCLFSIDEKKNIAKGSGRSVTGFDLGTAVINARNQGLLSSGGGHAMAAGMTVNAKEQNNPLASMIDRFGQYLIDSFSESGVAVGGDYYIDGVLDIRGANLDLLNQLERLSPFGMGNRQPRFVLHKAKIMKPEIVGEKHIRCFLTGPSGGSLKAIAFNVSGTSLGKEMLQTRSLPYDVAGYLKTNFWQGKESAQFIIEDMASMHG
ncbi:MAG: single-stranded-DNA-specific exonuclease RecJ [Pseudomonadota bacterium]|nr:single-stranded-DNA-specific exonuclease RecJ [Pseudomonadota bacterium]MED5339832.1 single-stranded-DNA-specific exonuclease RecJ [Pseudomonadota bacterium]